jgi:uncharacterized protein YkwD
LTYFSRCAHSSAVPFPGIRHLGLILAVAAAAGFAPQAASAETHRVIAAAKLEAGVAARMNLVRRWHGLPPLRYSRGLAAAARGHSRDMGVRGYFEHDSAGGAAFWARIERSYASEGFSRWEVGENIAWSAPSANPVQVVRQWMQSPAHRANLLSATWRDFGLGAYRVPRAGGSYGGRAVTIVTLDLGIRAR